MNYILLGVAVVFVAGIVLIVFGPALYDRQTEKRKKERAEKNAEMRKKYPPPYYEGDALKFQSELLSLAGRLISQKALANARRNMHEHPGDSSWENVNTLDMERAARKVFADLIEHVKTCHEPSGERCDVALNLSHLEDLRRRYASENQTP